MANPAPDIAPQTATKLLANLVERKPLAIEVKRSERTIIRWERAGMPFIKLGSMRLYDLDKVREWILGHECRPRAPVRGRPRKRWD